MTNETKRNDKIIKKEWFHKNKAKWFPCKNEEILKLASRQQFLFIAKI